MSRSKLTIESYLLLNADNQREKKTQIDENVYILQTKKEKTDKKQTK